jgi:hypothetical protein
MFFVMHIHEAFPVVRAEFAFTKTIGALSRNMSDMMDEALPCKSATDPK